MISNETCNLRVGKSLADASAAGKSTSDAYIIPRRVFFQKICENRVFKTMGVVFSMAVIIHFGVVADMNLDQHSSMADLVISRFLFAFFAVEIILRFLVYVRPKDFFTDPLLRRSNIFDLGLVLVRLVRVFIIPLVSSGSYEYGVKHIFRMLEIFRLGRVLYAFPEVGLMVDALIAAARSAAPLLTLLVTSMYCGGVMSDLWYKKSPNMQNYTINNRTDFLGYQFGNVGWAMLTQLQLASFETYLTLAAAYETSIPFCLFLLMFIAINSFMIINTLIGFIFNLVAETREKAAETKRQFLIKKTFNLIDKDFSNSISQSEYDTSAIPVLRRNGVSDDIVDKAFAIIDSDGNNLIDKSEFSTYLLKMLRPPNNEELIKLSNELLIIEHKLLEMIQMKETGTVTQQQMDSIHHRHHRGKIRRGLFFQHNK